MLLHNDVIVLRRCERHAECLVTTLCSNRTVHRHAAPRTCNSWTAASRNAKFSLCPTRGLQTAQISLLWSTRSGLSCSIVSTTDKSIVWMKWNSRFLTRLLTSGEEDMERVSVLQEHISSTACELTMLILSISVTFHATCLTVTSLITKSCQQRWPIHSCLFYKVVH